MIAQYIKYRLKAKGIQSLHSPFMFEFYKNFKKNKKSTIPNELLAIFKEIRQDEHVIDAAGFGAGSRKKGTVLKVKDIAGRAGMQKRELPLIQTICSLYDSPVIVELGTNIGIGTAALSHYSQSGTIFTFEGNEGLLEYAKSFHKRHDFRNIHYVQGDIHETLASNLSDLEIDIAYIDADHTYEATVSFYKFLRSRMKSKALMVFDDIYWSEGMTRAWNEIIQDESVQVSVDMFDKGLIFIDPNLTKQHYVLRQ